jgi:mono/diheme cytochrome c family protein
VGHLRDNIAAADIELPADAVEELDRIGARQCALCHSRHGFGCFDFDSTGSDP